jgi:hypothetical protein
MRNLSLVFPVLIILFVLSDIVQAENTIVSSDSNKGIVQAMELSLRSNSLSYLYAQGNSRIDSIYKANTQPDSLKLKDPREALFYAALPGFFVHGAGHFYAGRNLAGAILLTTEIASFGLAFYSMVRGLGEMESGNSDTPELLAFGAMTLFIGSWIYDMIFAPLSVVHQNERILYRKADNLGFKLRI